MNTSVTPSSSQEGISLSNEQRDGVIEQFVELVVDGMDTKDLVRYVSEQLTEYYEDCSDIELKEFQLILIQFLINQYLNLWRVILEKLLVVIIHHSK